MTKACNDHTQAVRMRRYRGRLALVRAVVRALESGNYPHRVMEIVESTLQVERDRNADPRYGQRPRYDLRTLVQKDRDGDFFA